MLYLNFVSDFLDSRRAHAIEQLHHFSVERFSICAEEDFNIWIPLMECEQPWHHVTVGDHFLIEMDESIGIDKQTDAISGVGGRQRLRGRDHRGQVHANALHVDLAQAHHHETGEEKEHNVDQGNDFDPGSFLWNWRSDLHTGSDR